MAIQRIRQGLKQMNFSLFGFLMGLKEHIFRNFDMYVVIFIVGLYGMNWGQETFATEPQVRETVQEEIEPLTDEINELKAEVADLRVSVTQNGLNIYEGQMQSLRNERRSLNREINVLMRTIGAGEGTERDLASLDELESDLVEVEEEIDRLEQSGP